MVQYDSMSGCFVGTANTFMFLYCTIRGNGGACKGCMNPRKDFNKGYIKIPPKCLMIEVLGINNDGKVNMY